MPRASLVGHRTYMQVTSVQAVSMQLLPLQVVPVQVSPVQAACIAGQDVQLSSLHCIA